jgi:hypothetical protein
MLLKLFALAALFASVLPLNMSVFAQDDDGDLNPQPLPPIAEEEFSIIG